MLISVANVKHQANKYNQSIRNLSYKSFLESLALVAFEMDCGFDDVVAMLGVTPIAHSTATKAPAAEDHFTPPL